jgi:hypothetical protein
MNLRLNKEVYNLDDIRTGIKGYENLCSISVADDGKYWTCCFTECRYDALVTAREFENYIINVMNCR